MAAARIKIIRCPDPQGVLNGKDHDRDHFYALEDRHIRLQLGEGLQDQGGYVEDNGQHQEQIEQAAGQVFCLADLDDLKDPLPAVFFFIRLLFSQMGDIRPFARVLFCAVFIPAAGGPVPVPGGLFSFPGCHFSSSVRPLSLRRRGFRGILSQYFYRVMCYY